MMSPLTCTARRMFELLEPICLVTFFAEECTEEMAALGHRTYWDGYFASRAAPLGRVPAQVVHAAFYSFAEGEAARHIPSAWETVPPEVSFAAWRALPVPSDPVTRLWHSATMLREHRGDGHVAALDGARIGGTESHVLSALEMGIHPPESFGRIHHLPKQRLAAVMDGLRERGLVDPDGRFTDAGRETKQRIEALTDELAAPPYDALSPAELDELDDELEPLTAP